MEDYGEGEGDFYWLAVDQAGGPFFGAAVEDAEGFGVKCGAHAADSSATVISSAGEVSCFSPFLLQVQE